MRSKELQLQYKYNLEKKPAPARDRISYVPDGVFIRHIYNQASIIGRLLGKDAGDYYLEDALRTIKESRIYVENLNKNAWP